MSIKRNTIWNLAGSVVPLAVGIAVIPYIYKQIGIERIGILTIIWALIGYFSIFDFGLGRAITQQIASLGSKVNASQKKNIATTGVLLTLLIGLMGGLIGAIFIEFVGVRWINSSPKYEQEIIFSFLLACIAVPATTVTSALRGVLEAELRFSVINLFRIILGLTNFLGPVLSIALFGPRLDYIVGSLAVARYAILLAHQVSVRHVFSFTKIIYNREELRRLINFGGWMTISNTIGPLMVVADRFLISNVLGAAVVAFYTVPAEFMLRLLVLPTALTVSLFPVFSKDIAEKNIANASKLYEKSIKLIFAIMGSITVFICIGAEFFIGIWLGPEFGQKSATVASILALGILFNSIAQVSISYIQASGDSRSTALIHLFEVALYIPALIFFMQWLGILGVAIAWMLRAFLDLVLLHFRVIQLKIIK